MENKSRSLPRFHQAALASAVTLSAIYPNITLAAACHSFATNPFVVNIATEDSRCDDFVSLREAIRYANEISGKDTITFSDSLKGKTIEAIDGQIVINESINIVGPDADNLLILKANDTDSLFYIDSFEDHTEFDLSNVILEKAGGADYLIEMSGYGSDVNLDNIHTTDATRAYGIFSGETQPSASGEFDLNLTLKNSSISGSTFTNTTLSSGSSRNTGENRISIIDSKITNNTGNTLVSSSGGDAKSHIEIKRSNISGNTVSYPFSSFSNYGTATINIHDSSIIENEARSIARSYGYDSDAHLNISKSTISGNKVNSVLLSESYYENAHLNISDSTISSNIISSNGISTSGDNNSINIQNSILCDNITDYGGDVPGDYPLIAASNINALNVSDSNICNNQLQAFRIYANYGEDVIASIKNSVINNNHSTFSGAGVYVFTRGGGKGTERNLNISDSSISNNKSTQSGGGISIKTYDSFPIDVNINNSTISGNQTGTRTTDHGAGILVDGDINMDISNSTITNNTSTGFGGGVAMVEFDESTSLNIKNSIVADNTSAYGSGDLYGSFVITSSLIKDIPATSGTSINGTTMDQIGDEEGQTPDTGNNLLGVDPLLQDLALSGGSWVHQLSADSPAIDVGDANTENLPEFDQRGEGFARIRTVDGVSELDLGAVQYFASPVAINDEVSVTPGSENNLINVLNNDEQNSDGFALDPGSVTIMSYPENGDAEVQEDGTISYTPTADFVGTDSLTYVMQDIAGGTSTEATLTINVSESSGDSGGLLHFWVLSLLAVFGLRRSKPIKASSK
jgi:hypothetical protein